MGGYFGQRGGCPLQPNGEGASSPNERTRDSPRGPRAGTGRRNPIRQPTSVSTSGSSSTAPRTALQRLNSKRITTVSANSRYDNDMSRRPDPERKPELVAQILDYLLDKPLSGLSFRTLADALDVSTFTLVYQFAPGPSCSARSLKAISAPRGRNPPTAHRQPRHARHLLRGARTLLGVDASAPETGNCSASSSKPR